MTIKKFLLIVAIVTVSLSTFASDLLPVSAPILAVELNGYEQLPEAAAARRVSVVEMPPVQNAVPAPEQVEATQTKAISNEPSGAITTSEPEYRDGASTETEGVTSAERVYENAVVSMSSEEIQAINETRLSIKRTAEPKLTTTATFKPLSLIARKIDAPSFVSAFAGYFDSLVSEVKDLVPTDRPSLETARLPESVAATVPVPKIEAERKNATTSIFVPFAEYFASMSNEVSTTGATERDSSSNENAIANEVAISIASDVKPEQLEAANLSTEKAAEFESEVATAPSESDLSLSTETAVSDQAATELVSLRSSGAVALTTTAANVTDQIESEVASAPGESHSSLNNSYAVALLSPHAEVVSTNADDRSNILISKPVVRQVVSQASAVTPSMFETFLPNLAAEYRDNLNTDSRIETYTAMSSSMFDAFVPTLAAEQRSELRTDSPMSESAAVAIDRSPVTISNRSELSIAQLPRFAIEPLPAAESFADAISSLSRGPNSEATLVTEALPKTATDAKNDAMLIGGRTMFSNDLLKPMNSANPKLAQVQQGYCDASFVGQPIRFSQTVELKLEDLLSQLHTRFGVNFIMGPNIGKLPLNVKAGAIPWNVLLRSQLFISGVRAKCIDANTIELVENTVLPQLQDGAPVTSRFVKLKFLQRTSGGTVDLANRSQGGQNGGQGGCGGSGGGGQSGGSSSGGGAGGGGGGQSGQTAAQQGSSRFDQLIVEIEKILGLRSMTESGGGSGSGGGTTSEAKRSNRSVTQIPGRNILVIKATEEEHALIDQIIARADRAPFQVVIKGLVYTANETKLRDIGAQTTITGGSADGRTGGGIFGHTLGSGGTLFDFSAMLGTFDFNVQVNALQQNGVLVIKSRPFSTVLDGLCTRLDVGTSLPIVIDSALGGEGSVTFVNAANNLSVTPYVIDDENGNPMAVTLELSLAANAVDTTVVSRGVPSVSQRSIQTQLLLGEDKTAILGGFTVDQDRKDISKTPFLGDIPIIGELFKRRVRDTQLNRLYFAISVSVIPFPEAIEPVKVPGATTDPPTITQEMKNRADEGEPKPYDPNKPADPKKKKKDNDNR